MSSADISGHLAVAGLRTLTSTDLRIIERTMVSLFDDTAFIKAVTYPPPICRLWDVLPPRRNPHRPEVVGSCPTALGQSPYPTAADSPTTHGIVGPPSASGRAPHRPAAVPPPCSKPPFRFCVSARPNVEGGVTPFASA